MSRCTTNQPTSLFLSRLNRPAQKGSPLHPRNRHRPIDGVGYQFDELLSANPDLNPHVFIGKHGQHTINFADDKAVRELNRALILAYYDVQFWQIPEQFLCPAVPGRADYIHYLADLLVASNNGEIPTGKGVKGLDVGTGANLIYPIIGQKEYRWSFLASECNPVSFQTAKAILDSNGNLKRAIKIKQQTSPEHIFENIISPDNRLAFTICNPPFHTSAAEAAKSNITKQQKLAKHKRSKQQSSDLQPSIVKKDYNFGGQNSELWCEGGEVEFVCKMIRESSKFQTQVLWFSSLISKQQSLAKVQAELANHGVTNSKIINMGQGQKISRFIAWSFIPEKEHSAWFK